MKSAKSETLSQHLLAEASKFMFYPKRVRRTAATLAIQPIIANALRAPIEWRKTFAPEEVNAVPAIIVDEVYCRDLLHAVPAMVARTMALRQLELPQTDESEWMVYLKESANCYILGLPQASVTLARAAVESRLRAACSKMLGEEVVRQADLVHVIDDLCGRAVLLSASNRTLAHRVRSSANDVLHNKPIESTQALEVFEAARSVIVYVLESLFKHW